MPEIEDVLADFVVEQTPDQLERWRENHAKVSKAMEPLYLQEQHHHAELTEKEVRVIVKRVLDKIVRNMADNSNPEQNPQNAT